MDKAKKNAKRKKRLRDIAGLYKFVQKPVVKLTHFIGKRVGYDDLECNLLMPFSNAIEDESNCYVTYSLYPKKAIDYNSWLYFPGKHSEDVAIVIQGPIRKEDNFTLETVRLYRRLFPNVLVIISTWKTEDDRTIDELKLEPNCIVVQSETPKISGIANINYQVKSSLEGTKEARRRGKKYVLKTRSDSRVTMPGILEQLVDLTELNPVKDKTKVQARITMFGAYLLLPYNEFATYYFGHVDDMITLFSCGEHEGKVIENYANKMIANNCTYREHYNEGTALNWVIKNYFENIFGFTTCDCSEWWKRLAEYTICMPVSSLKPLWVKYDYNREESDMTWIYKRTILGSCGVDNSMVDYACWKSMKDDTFDWSLSEKYEHIIDEPMK